MSPRRPRLLLALATTFLVGTALTANGEAASSSPPCNPYFPLAPGASWTYREGPPGGKPRVEKSVTVTSVEGEGEHRRAILEQSVRTPGAPGAALGRARTIAHCDRGRIGLTIQGAARGQDGDRASRGTVAARIPGLPPSDRLVPGYEWTSKSEIQAQEGDVRAVTEGFRRSRVAGREAVTVPAGRFDGALKIVSIETLRRHDGAAAARQEVVEWYAPWIGLVKRETRVQSGPRTATSVEVLVASSLAPRPPRAPER